jgi:hypothetical protein
MKCYLCGKKCRILHRVEVKIADDVVLSKYVCPICREDKKLSFLILEKLSKEVSNGI